MKIVDKSNSLKETDNNIVFTWKIESDEEANNRFLKEFVGEIDENENKAPLLTKKDFVANLKQMIENLNK